MPDERRLPVIRQRCVCPGAGMARSCGRARASSWLPGSALSAAAAFWLRSFAVPGLAALADSRLAGPADQQWESTGFWFCGASGSCRCGPRVGGSVKASVQRQDLLSELDTGEQ